MKIKLCATCEWAMYVYGGDVILAKLFEADGEWFYSMMLDPERCKYVPLQAKNLAEAKEAFVKAVREELKEERDWFNGMLAQLD